MGPNYEKIASLLSSNKVFNSVSELHGVVSGQICGGTREVNLELTQQLLDIDVELAGVVQQLISRLGDDISAQMEAGDFTFTPLLPDDEEEINLRLHALGQWCEGFNVGFGASVGKSDKSILEETREVINDFAAIAEIDDSPVDADIEAEEQEVNYMEIVEYIRTAAATVFLQNTKVSGAQSSKLNEIH